MALKNRILVLILTLTAAATLSAHETFRTAGILASEPETDNSRMSEREGGFSFWGLETEAITSDNTGFGMDTIVNFYTDELNNSMLDWQGQLFMRYHLFGAQSFLDPFIEAGIGNAGSVRLQDGDELKMSLYPFLSAGGNLVFHGGFYAGMRWSWKLDQWTVPGTVIPLQDFAGHQVSFTVGYSYSLHERHYRYDHYHYHFE